MLVAKDDKNMVDARQAAAQRVDVVDIKLFNVADFIETPGFYFDEV